MEPDKESTRASRRRSVGRSRLGSEYSERYVVEKLEEAGAEHGVQLNPVVAVSVDDDAQGFYCGDAQVGEPAQEAVLTTGQTLVHLLQGVEPTDVGHEAHDVA